MKPRTKLAESQTPDGAPMALYEHDGTFAISFQGQELMHSAASASERLLGELGVERLKRTEAPRVLIGGLGLGFTLKAVLDQLGPGAKVEVAELLQPVVDWNRRFLRGLNGALLDDPRVRLHVGDAVPLIRKAHPNSYDAVILDVDNGPSGMVRESNNSLYSRPGMRSVYSALKPEGRTVVWSAGEDPHFKERMQLAGFRVGVVPAKTHERAKRAAYRIFVGDRSR